MNEMTSPLATPVGYSDVRTSPTIAALAEALAAAQGEMEMPDKDREVTVQPREGRAYKFSYATLDNIVATTRPALAKHGLSVIQPIIAANNRTIIVTRLMHKSGEWLESSIDVKAEKPGAQALGSAISYARRYSYSALLGIVADDDDDANEASGNTVVARQDRRPAPPSGSMREEARRLVGGAAPAAAEETPPATFKLIAHDGGEYDIAKGRNGQPAHLVWFAAWKSALARLASPEEVGQWAAANAAHLAAMRRWYPEVADAAVKAKEDRAEALDFPGDRPSRDEMAGAK